MDKYFYRQNSEKDQQYTLFYKSNFIRRKALIFEKKLRTS